MTGMISLRGRLTLWFTILLVAMGLIGGIAAYLITRNDPDRFVDDQLRQIALEIGDPTATAAARARAGLDPSDVVAVQAWDAAGHVVRATPPGIALPRQATTGFSELTSAGERWRTYTLAGPERTVQVAQRATVVQEIALGAAWQAILPVLLLIPSSWLLVRLLVARILRPLDALARDLEDRAPGARAPLAAHAIPSEVAPLVAAVNATLARLAEALALQRRFVSDAAHQLRTPLTALRLQVGNLKRAGAAHDPDLLDDMEQGLKRMSTLTAQLLALARAEAATAEPGSADLATAIDEAIAATAPLAAARQIAVTAAPEADIEVAATPQELTVLFTNLIDNAVRYTTVGGRVEIRLEPGGETVAVEIVDTGRGLPEEMLDRVFEPFVRHAEDGEGTGLGLAIVRAIAERVGAGVSLRNRGVAGGLVARVELQGGRLARPATARGSGSRASDHAATQRLRRPPGDDQEPVGMTRWRRQVLVVAAILVALAATALAFDRLGWLDRSQARAEPPEAAVPVVAGRVGRADVPIYLTGIGTVQPFNRVVVKSRVDGQIVKIDFGEGQDVHAGDVLAEIDPAPFAAALAQAQAMKLKDEAQLDNARRDLARANRLAAAGNEAVQQLDTTRSLVAQLEASLKADQAAIDAAQIELDYAKIRSPITGRAGMRTLDLGNIVHAADATGIVTVNQIQPISVTFSLPADSLAPLRDAMRKGDVEVDAEAKGGHRLATGKLSVIDNQINTATATIGYKAVFANADDALWPGQFVDVRVLAGIRRGAVTVPATAVLRGPEGTYAFVIGPDRRVQKRAVKVAWSDQDLAVIADGLAPGQQVVADGQYRIQAGTLIDAVPAAAGASP